MGNLIGTDSTGTVAVPNAVGISVVNGDNTIGGTIPTARNLISGNTGDGIQVGFFPGFSTNTLIEGNFIGLDSTGGVALANGGDGIDITAPPQPGGSATTIGGSIAGSGNVISANVGVGISIETNNSGNLIEGNFIGTDSTGATSTDPNSDSLGNQQGGILDVAANDTIGGLTSGARNVISGNPMFGVSLGESIYTAATDATVVGNYIGTNVTGTVALPNDLGVQLAGGGNTIGGTASGAGNVISGNGSGISDTATAGSLIEGNFIGTDAGGTAALGNTADGIDVSASGQTIGGAATGAGNLISGNGGDGIQIAGHPLGFVFGSPAEDNVIQGNLIGTNVTGDSAIPNYDGVDVVGGYAGNTIGGTVYGAGNVISGNTNDGILLLGTAANTIFGNRIGTDQTGTIVLANRSDGIQLADATILVGAHFVDGHLVIGGRERFGATDNTIGGTAAGAANIISGNTSDGVEISGKLTADNLLEGNQIGTDSTGTVAIANGSGIEIDTESHENTIGGTTVAARNIISGNRGSGVEIGEASLNVVAGNWIGVDATGASALANAAYGVSIQGASAAGNGTGGAGGTGATGGSGSSTTSTGGGGTGTTSGKSNIIGGTTAGSGNVISGNGSGGIFISMGTLDIVAGNWIGTDRRRHRGAGQHRRRRGRRTMTSAEHDRRHVARRRQPDLRQRPTASRSTTPARNLVQGNLIGIDQTGTLALGNIGRRRAGRQRFRHPTRSAGRWAGRATSSRATPKG